LSWQAAMAVVSWDVSSFVFFFIREVSPIVAASILNCLAAARRVRSSDDRGAFTRFRTDLLS
jgi:hypothetical protein